MVNRDLLAAKFAELSARVERVRAHSKGSATELAGDADATDLVSFNLMLALQVCADIASHIVADEGWPVARTLGESFTRLAEHRVVSEETARAMARAAAFRTVVAHGYSSVDMSIVHRASTEGIADIDRFARDVATWALPPPQ
jgi:uncharacterized protein YutE (UPF0331/DUF86 family)